MWGSGNGFIAQQTKDAHLQCCLLLMTIGNKTILHPVVQATKERVRLNKARRAVDKCMGGPKPDIRHGTL